MDVLCSWVLLDWPWPSLGGGDGVLRPGCGSWAVDCGGDGSEGQNLIGLCRFGCVLMAGTGDSML